MRPPAGSAGDAASFLRRLPLFAGVGEGALAALGRACTPRAIPRGSYVFLQSEPAESVYLVQSGVVSILLASADGRELVINELRPGDCFGELGALTGRPRSASAMARTDSVLLAIPTQALREALAVDAELARRLLTLTAARLQDSS